MKITILLLSIFDFFNKRKILNFFKSKFINIDMIFDIGAHRGETLDLFYNNFKVKNYYAFEASPINFKFLEKKIFKLNKNNINIINKAAGNSEEETDFYQLDESSSSTMNKINHDSKYYKKKTFLINLFSLGKSKTIEFKLKPILLSDFIDSNNIKKIDILKIDTEGYELRVIKGLSKKIKIVDYIYFEHHYDDMIKKGYTFSMINSYLMENGFTKVFKLKMFFRKSFEYIYQNTKTS